MRSVSSTATALAIFRTLAVSGADACPDLLSCSTEAASDQVDTCCTPSPGGLFVFRQRFEPDFGADAGSWGIDGIDILDCNSQKASSTAYGPAYTHEEIGSYCHQSEMFGGEEGFTKAEGEWASSEVGEGVEEVWERAWSTAGRYISTLAPSCHPDTPLGSEVAAFFHTLSHLYSKFPISKSLSEADITPSADTIYSLKELSAALSFDDHQPVVMCDNVTLSTVLWPLNVLGSFQSGTWQPSDSYSQKSNCPAEGIIYQPSTTRPVPSATSDTWDIFRRPTPRPITLGHDESKLYYQPREDPAKLGFFKDNDESRDEDKQEKTDKKYWRDEL